MSTHTDMNVTMMREFIQSIDMDRFLRKEMETISSLNNTNSSMCWLDFSGDPNSRELDGPRQEIRTA
jgi:hypothetical protein